MYTTIALNVLGATWYRRRHRDHDRIRIWGRRFSSFPSFSFAREVARGRLSLPLRCGAPVAGPSAPAPGSWGSRPGEPTEISMHARSRYESILYRRPRRARGGQCRAQPALGTSSFLDSVIQRTRMTHVRPESRATALAQLRNRRTGVYSTRAPGALQPHRTCSSIYVIPTAGPSSRSQAQLTTGRDMQ